MRDQSAYVIRAYFVNITMIINVIGPPLPPHPQFHVVNATHIEVQWNKPFSFSAEFDITNYTLTTQSEGSQSSNEASFPVTTNTSYPFIHYISNNGTIARECVHMNFTVTATNEVGTSDGGVATGGFPIGERTQRSYLVHVQYMSSKIVIHGTWYPDFKFLM